MESKNRRVIITLSCLYLIAAAWPQLCDSRTVAGADSSADDIVDDFQSQCSTKSDRDSSFKKPPQVIIFSSADHNANTLGCTPNKVISLGLEKSGSNLEGDTDDWQLNTTSIRQLLIDSGSYDKKAPSYLLVHGFLSSWNGDTWMCKLKDKILNETQANVFIVDWSGGSKPMLPIDYGAAVANTKYVGQLLAKFLLTLLEMTNQSDATKFHLIGHSLGAHISGFVGYALGDTPLGRITGLDPAGPCFSSDDKQSREEKDRISSTGDLPGNRKRLSSESADLVMAIHTDTTKFGLNENCGHYDIYVNGGSSQPVCVGQSAEDRLNSLVDGRPKDAVNVGDVVCSHSYSHDLTAAWMPIIYNALEHPVLISDGKQGFREQYEFDLPDKQCYLMSHRCASWRAFLDGECGLRGGDQSDESRVAELFALDPELDSTQLARAAVVAATHDPAPESVNRKLSDTDDEYVNDEDDDGSQSSVNSQNTESSSRHWQHFVKTSRSKPSLCAFTYQMVIAAEPAEGNKDKGKLYVDIPLDLEPGLLNVRPGDKKLNRLVQISHKVNRSSSARSELVKVSQSLSENADQLDYYTSLITFDAASSNECHELVTSSDPKTDRKRWYLCQAISRIEGAHLWSTDEKTLKRVKWVAMAYLSGSNSTIRHDNSYLFEPDFSDIEKNRSGDEATTDMRDEKRGLSRKVSKSFKCLLSRVLKNGSSCHFGTIRPQYSTPLRAVWDESKRQVLQT